MENEVNIKLTEYGKGFYYVRTSTNKFLGTFELDETGSYNFWYSGGGGSWSSHSLRLIADKLDEINKPFSDKVNEYFEQERRDFEERARVEYRTLLNESGMFFEFYPYFTGEYKKDKEQWLIEYKKIEDLRAQNNSF